jgi:hypothetical protein
MSVYYSTCGTSEVLAHVNLYSTLERALAPSDDLEGLENKYDQ